MVRLTRTGGALLLVAALLVAAVAASPAVRAAEPADVRILFDLGEGTTLWSTVYVPDRLAANASWNASLEAAAAHDLRIEYQWFGSLGVSVTSILPPGWRPPPGYVALYLWNPDTAEWTLPSVGISSLVLRDGDSIAWANAGYDPDTFAPRYPVPTPLDPYPAVSFREDGANTGAYVSKAPNGATVLWDHDTGVREIAATPAIAYGRVYVLTMSGLFALDAATGAVRWEEPSLRGFSSPTVHDGSLFFGGRDGSEYRVNATDGIVQWRTPLIANPQFSGITSSAHVVYDHVYVGTFNESGGAGELVSLWTSNGTVAWRLDAGGSIHYSTPAFTGDRLLVGVAGNYTGAGISPFDPPYGLMAVALNGTRLWFFPTGRPVIASPLVDGPLAVVASQDGSVYSVNWTSGAQIWRRDVASSISSAALYGGVVCVGFGILGGSGTVLALNAQTGDTEWQFTPNGPVQSSVAYADGKVFFSTNTAQGTIYALNATSGDEVWAYTPSPEDYILGSPAVSGGTLYAPSDNGHLYALRDTSAALANFSFAAPGGLVKDQEGIVNLSVRAVAGRLTAAEVTVNLPPGLAFASASPQPSNVTGASLEWYIGLLPFQWRYNISLVLRAVAGSDTNATVTATLTSSDAAGAPRTPLVLTFSIPIRVPAGSLAWLPLALGVAALLVAILAVVLMYRGRRRRAAP